MGVMFCPKSLDSLSFYYTMLWMIFLPAAALKSGPSTNFITTSTLGKSISPIIPTTSTSGKSGDGGNSGDELAYHPTYTRLIPAVATIGVFLVGLLVIYIIYCVKSKESKNKKKEEPVPEDEQMNNDWLAELRKTQKKQSLSNVFSRRGSNFQTKLKLKKYALYDEMLARYKRSLKMQKLHSMRKTNTTTSNISQSSDSYDDLGTAGSSPHHVLRKSSSKQRMKELAMRHKINQEQGFGDLLLEPPSRERHLPRWGTTSSSVSQDDTDVLKFKSDTEMEAFREGFCKSMDYSPGHSFQISTDDDTEPLLSSPTRKMGHHHLPPNNHNNWKAPPVSKNESERSSFDKDDVFGDHVVEDIPSSNVGGETDEEGRNILDQPDIKDALRKLSTVDEPMARTNNHKRPKSMVAMLSGGLISSGVANGNKPVDRATQKRLSWYQGLFKSPTKKNDSQTASVDDLIERQVNKALYSRLLDHDQEDESMTNSTGSSDLKERNPNLRQRPKSWMPQSEAQRKKQQQHREDKITELFANLMDLPKPKKQEKAWYREEGPSASMSRDGVPSPVDEGIDISTDANAMSEKEEIMLIDEVERRLIENIEDSSVMQDSEVLALENLLNDVARFCTEYSEDYDDVESRRQPSFSEMNATLERKRLNSSKEEPFEQRNEKAISVYDTQLHYTEPHEEPPTTTL
ncbi:uncharacterized protein [Clytia hemisphaerica]|uniref:Uncharacterized protein n=1 Tax=Clytia hemisphaerica TaxID=252671 RepID=A0A7M5X9F1_9CNID